MGGKFRLAMLDLKTKPFLDFPDDPLKWDGWSKYKADNFYERLCLDPKSKPGDDVELITRADWNKANESFYGFSSLLAPYGPAPIASSTSWR